MTLTIDAACSTLLVIDFQGRLQPVIEGWDLAVANARRLLDAASALDVTAIFTEQNPSGLGGTVAELAPQDGVAHKMTFDAVRTPGFLERIPEANAVVVAGCEAHVCVLQTVLGLLDAGRKVYVVRDALGARRTESKETAVRRMERHGAEIVTTEMVIFEWLGTCEHPRFREVVALVK